MSNWVASSIVIAVIVVDQLVKYYIQTHMMVNESIPVIQDILHITYVRNKGGAFSILNNLPESIRVPFFVIVGISFMAFIVYYFRNFLKKSGFARICFALIIGGALGNLIDRIRFGEVVDFFEVGINASLKWPVFNVADSCISVGIVLLLIHILMTKEEK
jgi:signal peptidase II